jgi:hypothetical protein
MDVDKLPKEALDYKHIVDRFHNEFQTKTEALKPQF